MTHFGFDFCRFWAPQTRPNRVCKTVWGGLEIYFFSHVIIVVFWSSPRRPPEGPRGAQEAPGSLQERPKRPQEASKSAPGGFKRASRDPKSRSRGFRTRPRAPESLPRRAQDFSEAHGTAAVFGKFKNFKSFFPKHLVRQPFSEKSKKSNHSSKKHRRHLRSPVSMNPKGLASNRRMKKGGRAAAVPLGEVNKRFGSLFGTHLHSFLFIQI